MLELSEQAEVIAETSVATPVPWREGHQAGCVDARYEALECLTMHYLALQVPRFSWFPFSPSVLNTHRHVIIYHHSSLIPIFQIVVNLSLNFLKRYILMIFLKKK